MSDIFCVVESRTSRVFDEQTQLASATRRYATESPTPPMPDKKSSGNAFLIGVLLAAGAGGGYYYYSSSRSEVDVKQKARELDHAARAQANMKIDEGRQKLDDAKVSS